MISTFFETALNIIGEEIVFGEIGVAPDFNFAIFINADEIFWYFEIPDQLV